MKTKIYNWIFKLVLAFIAKRITNSNDKLTSQYLISKGWVAEIDPIRHKIFYVEDYVKDRDKIYIDFESNCYRIWHSDKKTFIAAQSSIEWFKIYYMILTYPF